MYDNRLFAIFDCWDFSQNVQIAFRQKAMLSLAQQTHEDPDTYQSELAAGNIRHPLLASLRVRIKKSTGERDMTALVVEAEPVFLNANFDFPNDSIQAIHTLVTAAGPPCSERLVAAQLQDISHSPFYNLTAKGGPAEKALVLLYFTKQSMGNQQASGFRLVTDNVLDGCESPLLQSTTAPKYGVIARCTIERVPDFTAAKGKYALAIVCKATKPAKQQHAMDLYIEAMESLATDDAARAATIVTKLRDVAAADRSRSEGSQESPFQQRKCRHMLRYPTMSS